jgi:hypothetical protein
MVAAIVVDPRTKGLKHLSSAEEKRAAKAAFKRAYIQWGKQAHGFSDTLHQAHGRAHENQVRIKRESVEGSGAAGVQPSKKQKVSVAINEGGLVGGGGGGAINEADLDWDDEDTVVVMSVEEQLDIEFSQVWSTWMKEVRVSWGDLFPQAPQSVQQGNEIDLGNVEDWLTLDMRRVFDWLSGKTQSITHKEATTSAAAHVVTVLGFNQGQVGLHRAHGLCLYWRQHELKLL